MYISQLVYCFSLVPIPNNETFDKLDSDFMYFIWKGQHKTAKPVLYQPLERGGLDAPHTRFKHDTFKLVWLHRALHNEVFWAQEFCDKFTCTLEELLKYNQNLQGIKSWLKPEARLQGFWLEVLTLCVKHTYVTGCNRLPPEEILIFPFYIIRLYLNWRIGLRPPNCYLDGILLK